MRILFNYMKFIEFHFVFTLCSLNITMYLETMRKSFTSLASSQQFCFNNLQSTKTSLHKSQISSFHLLSLILCMFIICSLNHYVHIIPEKSFLFCFCVTNFVLIGFPSEKYIQCEGSVKTNRRVEFPLKYSKMGGVIIK